MTKCSNVTTFQCKEDANRYQFTRIQLCIVNAVEFQTKW
jgi:hypothetical protein